MDFEIIPFIFCKCLAKKNIEARHQTLLETLLPKCPNDVSIHGCQSVSSKREGSSLLSPHFPKPRSFVLAMYALIFHSKFKH